MKQWLVLEQWITPSLFSKASGGPVDEWTWGQNQDKGKATQLLQQHWDTWITQDDFRQIAAAGLNSVRIPIGTWAFALYDGEPYITGAQAYLDKAIGWAQQYGIQVLIDLHGAPGSQNGFDNSGHAGDMNWPNQQSYVDFTVKVISQIAQKYTQAQYRQTVTAIFLLNEPAGFKGGNLIDALRGYHNQAINVVRQADSTITVILHDAFMTPSYWNGDNNGDKNLIMDTHYYHAFDPAVQALNWQGQIQRVCDAAGLFTNANKPVMAAEWSLAIGGNNLGTDNYGDFLRRFFDVQTQTFEKFGAGWTFWCWKTENSAEWSYKDSLANGWIPQDPTKHTYSYESLCGGGGGGAVATNNNNNGGGSTTADNSDNSNNNGGDSGNSGNSGNDNSNGNNGGNSNNNGVAASKKGGKKGGNGGGGGNGGWNGN
jgi:glucan 1,3-beta-glucosidase